jgi:hypothetical protein
VTGTTRADSRGGRRAGSPGVAARSLRLPGGPLALVAGRLALVAGLLGIVAGCAAPRPGPTPIADRPIHLDGRCAQVEDDGFREDARLRVVDNRVAELSWRLWVGRRGTCSFELADFRQTRLRPSIELVARDGSACKLMVWQEPRRITLAHADCERRCTPGIYEDAWPVMFDPQTGGCGTK